MRSQIFSLGSGLIVTLGMAAGASAAPIFTDGFESSELGVVGVSFDNWTHNRGFPDQGEIVDTAAHGGEQSLRIDDPSGSQSRGYVTAAFTEQTSGTVGLQLYIRPTAVDQPIEVSLLSSTGTPFATIILRSDGKVGYSSTGAWQNSSAVDYVVNDWNELELTADVDSKTWSLAFNDTSVISGVAAGTPAGAGATVGQIQIVGGSTAVTSFYVDDVSLAVVPEPAIASLLAPMGLALLGRRRARS